MDKPKQFRGFMKSLKDICRVEILKNVTIERVQQISFLPIPNVLKEFIVAFHIQTDFDLDGIFMDYNFCFPSHVHHKIHQIYPGVCSFDNSNILLKMELNGMCKICHNTGRNTMHDAKEREKWKSVRHKSIMSCHLQINGYNKLCHIFEFPLMSLEDLIIKAYLKGKKIPEQFIMGVLVVLIDVFTYLKGNDMCGWQLCQPRHVFVSESGEIKLENMLLYLPQKAGMHFNTDVPNSLSLYTPPDQLRGHHGGPQAAVWGLGCILHELMAHIPAVLLKQFTNHNLVQHYDPVNNFSLPVESVTGGFYSKNLQLLSQECLHRNPTRRPKLQDLRRRCENYFQRKTCSTVCISEFVFGVLNTY